jgi:hypothetical protein
MSTKKPTPEQIRVLRDEVLPAADQFNRTGSLRGVKIPDHDILQELHVDLLGFKYDTGCPTCIGDAIRMLGNVYRENAQTPGATWTVEYTGPGSEQSQVQDSGEQVVTVADGIVGAVKAFANTVRGMGGRFVKKSEPAVATPDHRIKLVDGAIAVEVPAHHMEAVKQIIADYHQGIQEATTGEQIQDVMVNTQHRLTMLMPEKADHWKMAIGQQWDNMVAKVKKTHQDPPPSPGDIQPGEEDVTA